MGDENNNQNTNPQDAMVQLMTAMREEMRNMKQELGDIINRLE